MSIGEYPSNDDSNISPISSEEYPDSGWEEADLDGPRPTVEIFSDGVLVVNGQIFDIDSTCLSIISSMGKSPDGVGSDDIKEKIFGGFASYEDIGPSPAQLTRFAESVDMLAALEEALGFELFEIIIDIDQDDASQLFVSKFEYTRRKKPYFDTEDQSSVETEAQEELDLLDEFQKTVIKGICAQNDFEQDEDCNTVPLSQIYQVIFGTDSPEFYEVVSYNKSIAAINKWFSDHDIELLLSRSVSVTGGVVLQVSDPSVLNGLQLRISQIEATLKNKASNTVEKVSSVDERPDIRNGVTKIISSHSVKPKKVVTNKRKNKIADGLYFPLKMTPSEIALIPDLGEYVGIPEEDMFQIRAILGNAISKAKYPRGADQRALIRFIKSARAKLIDPDEHSGVRVKLKRWEEAAFGTMVMSYERRIHGMADTILKDYQSVHLREVLIHAGIRGLNDAIERFVDDEDSNLAGYLGQRIYGTMIDTMRSDSAVSRGQIGRISMLSLETPATSSKAKFSDRGDAPVEYAEFLPATGPISDEAYDVIDRECSKLDEALKAIIEKVRLSWARPGTNPERDLTIFLCAYDLTSLMTDEELEYYRDLQLRSKQTEITPRVVMAEDLELTESRISQITTRTLARLTPYFDDEIKELLV